MNFHIGTATGIGGGGGHPPTIIGGIGIGGCGYCIFTSIVVTSFFGTAFTLAGGGHAGPTQAGGAAAGITIGVGAGIEPENVPAHAMVAAATTIRMNPRIPSFFTIPSSSFRKLIISENLLRLLTYVRRQPTSSPSWAWAEVAP